MYPTYSEKDLISPVTGELQLPQLILEEPDIAWWLDTWSTRVAVMDRIFDLSEPERIITETDRPKFALKFEDNIGEDGICCPREIRLVRFGDRHIPERVYGVEVQYDAGVEGGFREKLNTPLVPFDVNGLVEYERLGIKEEVPENRKIVFSSGHVDMLVTAVFNRIVKQ